MINLKKYFNCYVNFGIELILTFLVVFSFLKIKVKVGNDQSYIWNMYFNSKADLPTIIFYTTITNIGIVLLAFSFFHYINLIRKSSNISSNIGLVYMWFFVLAIQHGYGFSDFRWLNPFSYQYLLLLSSLAMIVWKWHDDVDDKWNTVPNSKLKVKMKDEKINILDVNDVIDDIL